MEIINSHDADKCCGKLISKALLAGELAAAESWICPKCGETWRPRMHETIRHWVMVPFVAVW